MPQRGSPSCRSAGLLNGPSHGSTDAVDWLRIGNACPARRSHSCASRPSASCCESYVKPANDPGWTLKGNQGTLREDVELFVAEQKSNGFKHAASSQDETVDGDHGRIETRNTTVLHDVS